MSPKLDHYEFKMALFDNVDLEGFLLFIRNFHMTLEESGMLIAGEKIQYLCKLVRGKAFCQIETLSDEVGSTSSEHLKSISLV